MSGEPYVDSRETHSGCVVLLGDLAYKVKKPVDLGFLDYTSRDARVSICHREVELNSRLAPDVYLGVGGIEVAGRPTEPVVVMRRMPEEARLSRLVEEGRTTPTLMRDLARTVAVFHSRAERSEAVSAEGTRGAITRRWEANLSQSRLLRPTVLEGAVLAEIESLVHDFLVGREPLFDERIAHRRIVDGHGDLIAQDIFCQPDGVRILDCLEFDDRLRYVDQLDDVAFLAMDLEQLGAPGLSTALLAAYVDFANDPAPPGLLHHFMAYRAFVRAKVSALRWSQGGGAGSDAAADARRFSDLAVRHLREGVVCLVLVGGPPGSGKTTLAGDLADRFGMVVLSSDRIRKELAGLDPSSSAAAAYEQGIYQPAWTDRTYTELLRRAELMLQRGESVILDASWTVRARRGAAEDLASTNAARLVQLQCSLDEETAAERIRVRSGVSDADPGIASTLRRAAGAWPGSVAIDTSRSRGAATEDAARAIRPPVRGLAGHIRSKMAPD